VEERGSGGVREWRSEGVAEGGEGRDRENRDGGNGWIFLLGSRVATRDRKRKDRGPR
jgi:hypothetical protein